MNDGSSAFEPTQSPVHGAAPQAYMPYYPCGFAWPYPYSPRPIPGPGLMRGAPHAYPSPYGPPFAGQAYPPMYRGSDMRGFFRRREEVQTLPWQGLPWSNPGLSALQGGPEATTARPTYVQFLKWAKSYPRNVAVHGSRTGKAVALTFDNAPDPVVTPRVLQILAAAHIQATFCCIGARVEQYPHLVKRIAAYGHEIVSHSFSHPNFCRLTEAEMGQQLGDTSAMIENVTGKPVSKWFRPPYGAVDESVLGTVSNHGYRTLLWDVDSLDWAGLNGYQIAANVLGHAQAGSIIVMNCGDPRTYIGDLLQAIRYVISGLKHQGYEFKTISAMATSG